MFGEGPEGLEDAAGGFCGGGGDDVGELVAGGGQHQVVVPGWRVHELDGGQCGLAVCQSDGAAVRFGGIWVCKLYKLASATPPQVPRPLSNFFFKNVSLGPPKLCMKLEVASPSTS